MDDLDDLTHTYQQLVSMRAAATVNAQDIAMLQSGMVDAQTALEAGNDKAVAFIADAQARLDAANEAQARAAMLDQEIADVAARIEALGGEA